MIIINPTTLSHNVVSKRTRAQQSESCVISFLYLEFENT